MHVVANGHVAQSAFDHLQNLIGALGIEGLGVNHEAIVFNARAGDHADGVIPVVVKQQGHRAALKAIHANGLAVMTQNFGAIDALVWLGTARR